MRVLITGGAGFIGSSLADELSKDKQKKIVIVDNFTTGKRSNIPRKKNVEFIKCDVNEYADIAPLMSANKFDYVYHFAAVVGVQRTLTAPVTVLNDIDGIRNILNLSKNTGVNRVFYASSSEVYGEPVEFPQKEETTPLNSRLPYAVVKNVGESFCKAFSREYNLDYTIFRFFNTYGSKQTSDFVVPIFLNAAMKNRPIHIYGDGLQCRTFCHISDNIETTVKVLEGELFNNQTINIGSDSEVSIIDLARRIVDLTGSSSKIVHLPPLEEGDMQRRKPDITKMISVIDRNPIQIEEGIKSILAESEVINLSRQ